MHDMPQAPSQRHFFFLLLQSSSDEHFLKHFWPSNVACSSSRGQSCDGKFLGFLYVFPSCCKTASEHKIMCQFRMYLYNSNFLNQNLLTYSASTESSSSSISSSGSSVAVGTLRTVKVKVSQTGELTSLILREHVQTSIMCCFPFPRESET